MVIIDVFIGLVLIYFLYSLLSSTLAELISNWIGMRARILRQGITNILNDKKPENGLWLDLYKWIKEGLLVEDNDFKFTPAGKFYQEPTIKYLAKPGGKHWYSILNRKPSYIAKSNFCNTILNMFSQKGRGVTEWEKIQFAVQYNALHLEPESDKMFKDFLSRSGGNYENFQAMIKNHFEEMTMRVNGWYKRKIGLGLFLIGLFLSFKMNVDTFQIIKILSENQKARQEMVDLAKSSLSLYHELGDSHLMDSTQEYIHLLQLREKTESSIGQSIKILNNGWNFKPEYGIRRIDTNKISNYKSILQNLFEAQKKSGIEAKAIQDSLARSTFNPKHIKELVAVRDQLDQNIKTKLDSLSHLTGFSIHSIDTLDTTNAAIQGYFYPQGIRKTALILSQSHPLTAKFWGFILTSFAISMGAKFWYDLLNKLVTLRGTGIKPEGNEKDKSASFIALTPIDIHRLNTKDPLKIAISQHGPYWECLPGFIAINEANDPATGRYIELTYEGGYNHDIPGYVQVVLDEKTYNISVKTIVGKKGEFAEGDEQFIPKKGNIRQVATGTWGTAAGLVLNNRTNRIAVLTCGHVARTDFSPYIDKNKDSVFFHNGISLIPIGRVNNVVMSSFSDGGVIDLFESIDTTDLELMPINNIQEITIRDENKTEVIVKTARGPINAKVISSSKSYSFNDRSAKDIKFYDLISIGNLVSSNLTPITSHGDSGSLVVTKIGEKPIGIIVGGTTDNDKNISYAIKMNDIFEILQLKPII